MGMVAVAAFAARAVTVPIGVTIHSYLTMHQIGRHLPKPTIFTVRPAEFDRDILALSVAGLGKALSKCREQASVWFRRARMQEADYRHFLLLRSRRQRPRDRAADKRNELAPPCMSRNAPQAWCP